MPLVKPMWRHRRYRVTESRFSEYGNFAEFPQRSPGWGVQGGGDGGGRKSYGKKKEGKRRKKKRRKVLKEKERKDVKN